MSELWKRNLPVPFFNQREIKYVWYQLKKDGSEKEVDETTNEILPGVPLAGESCNITSLCMVLHYFGITVDTPDELLKKVFEDPEFSTGFDQYRTTSDGYTNLQSLEGMKDVATKIYGVKNMQESWWKNEGRTIESLRDYIAGGYPVCFSFGPMYNNTGNNDPAQGQGHIAVIRGFTPNGDVIINDPWGDVASPYGFLKSTDNYPGLYMENAAGNNYYYGLGNGDNCILRKSELETIIKKAENSNDRVFNWTLVLKYPHVWAFPLKGTQMVSVTVSA
jgi:hypothetical protein